MSRFFIFRPVFAGVLAIIIIIAGLVAVNVLPVAQYPEIAPPTVTITTTYLGASAETIARTVAAPIEEQLSGVEHLSYFNSSSSSTGALTITATFDPGTNVDTAVFNVNNRVNLALPRLPADVRNIGVTVQKKSTDILLVASLVSPKSSYNTLFLSNYATLNLVDELKRVPGISDVTVFGARDFSMRVWLQPDKMALLGVTASDVAAALRVQNNQYAAGKIGAEPAPPGQNLVYTVTATGRLVDPEQFGNIVIRGNGPAGALKLKDVARLQLDAQTYDTSNELDGKPTIAMATYLQPGSNALQVAEAVKAKMDELKKQFPPDVDYLIPFDTTRFVVASISEVVKTIFEAAVLVVLVVFIFLQTVRATIIPVIAVPVSLIGTFAGLYAFGFSMNTLTLFALVLSIGIVVDDAIVVLENVERLMREEKLPPFEASLKAMEEVSGAVVAIVLVLCAVFVPVAFLGGIAGALYRQFAVTVAISVVISGFTALTLTPALCAIMMQAGGHHESKIFHPFNVAFDWLTKRFLWLVTFAIRNRVVSFLAFACVMGLVVFMFMRIPRSFVPAEDQGYVFTAMTLPDGASLQRTGRLASRTQQAISTNPAVQNVLTINGFDLIGGANKTNAATMFVPLKAWDERAATATEVSADILKKGAGEREGVVISFGPPAIRGLGSAGGFELYLQGRTNADPKALFDVLQNFLTALRADQQLTGINSFYRPTTPQLKVEVDREKALALGVPVSDVFDALQSTMGVLYVNDFNKFGHTYRVQMQADAPFRAKPDDLGNVFVRSGTSGEMIPLKSLITVSNIVGAETIERFNGYIAAKILGNGKAGVSSGQAIAEVERVARETLPQGYQITWSGQAFQELRTGNASFVAFGLALVMVFLILAALYERWKLPAAVLLAVPFAIGGALTFVMLRGMENDIYFQIGMIVLIGLAAKNAILIVEFAQQGYLNGMSAMDAAVEAARLRFRPIVMTSLAFVLGVVPLVFSSGAGAAARRSMGTGVFGGMLASTFIATIFVPLFFTMMATMRKRDLQDAELRATAAKPADLTHTEEGAQ
ncbi:MAG TPA: multidrug efflux RND transporter permease subunit [Burkholderiales bacterium]|jgi:HAE1 family hydrophobic/amphiphilic exporter-1/multidrug efflux pump